MQQVFPLFGPWDERKWVHGWHPIPIYPADELFEEGVTFKTEGKNEDEPFYYWRLVRLDRDHHRVQYVVTTANRQWSIDVSCLSIGDTVEVEVTYAFTPFNEKGAEYNQKALDDMYANDMKDWEKAVNHYLETGQTLVH